MTQTLMKTIGRNTSIDAKRCYDNQSNDNWKNSQIGSQKVTVFLFLLSLLSKDKHLTCKRHYKLFTKVIQRPSEESLG
jgi:hypothetical protein